MIYQVCVPPPLRPGGEKRMLKLLGLVIGKLSRSSMGYDEESSIQGRQPSKETKFLFNFKDAFTCNDFNRLLWVYIHYACVFLC